ncbi:unnamed protein product [Polarella glacialis]|uniref:Uncharacterized protein n=1 Tax=Polarella glacialis TaxID=89957 RepID=A0A813G265_POLGL|nr:unnamed protein product [Polarella glacialis]CAE8679332.1 unnamed protein product [Polarella glacialis]
MASSLASLRGAAPPRRSAILSVVIAVAAAAFAAHAAAGLLNFVGSSGSAASQRALRSDVHNGVALRQGPSDTSGAYAMGGPLQPDGLVVEAHLPASSGVSSILSNVKLALEQIERAATELQFSEEQLAAKQAVLSLIAAREEEAALREKELGAREAHLDSREQAIKASEAVMASLRSGIAVGLEQLAVLPPQQQQQQRQQQSLPQAAAAAIPPTHTLHTRGGGEWDISDADIEKFYAELTTGGKGGDPPKESVVGGLIVKFFHGEFTPQGFKRYAGHWKGPPPGNIGKKDIAVGMDGLKVQMKNPMFVTKGGVGYGVDETLKVVDDGKGWVWLAAEMSPGGLAIELFKSVPFGKRALLVAKQSDVDEMFSKVNWAVALGNIEKTFGGPLIKQR